MEFYREKLLPRGLPELLCQVIPEEFYANTKVIAYPRKQTRGLHGSVNFDSLVNCWVIKLYPTILSSFCWNHKLLGLRGTYSFDLWASFLSTSLHEIGHMVHWREAMNVPAYIDDIDDGGPLSSAWDYHDYSEGLANKWASITAERILAVDPRLGQPEGALGGYPGRLAYQRRGGDRPWGSQIDCGRINEWRAMRCGGQIPIGEIATRFCYSLPGQISHLEYDDIMKVRAIVRRAIHRAAKALGIARCFVNREGKRFLMFNAGESLRIFDWLKAHTIVGENVEGEPFVIGIGIPHRKKRERW